MGGRSWIFYLLPFAGSTLFNAPLSAQTQTGKDSSASRFFDEYGNARTARKPRRSVGGVLGGSELTTPSSVGGGLGLRPRGALPRGAEISDPFTYVSRPGAQPVSRLDLLLATPRPVPIWRQQVFRTYGGFGTRPGIKPGTEGTAAMSRRYALIGADSINAPVIRANWQSGFTSRVRLELEKTPFDANDGPMETEAEPDSDELAPEPLVVATLEEKLREDVLAIADRLRTEAWDAFKEGSYRRAARTFDSAASVERSDEARVGELFCHYSLGATSTASSVLSELNRHSANPFAVDLAMPAKFRRVDDVTRAKIQARLDAASAQSTPETAALAIFVLWFLNDRDEATSAATRLAKHADAEAYAAWPAKMKSVPPPGTMDVPRG